MSYVMSTSNPTFRGAHVLAFGGVQEPLPEPTPAELAAEAQQEAAVFSQAANVERLLSMLRTLDPAKDNLADNEEIQELYRSCMTLRPKIVKLIDKYSQKRGMLTLCIK
jgi:signal transducing adaptor molecule